MADQTIKSTNKIGTPTGIGAASHGFEKAASTAKGASDQAASVADQALSAGRDLKEKAIDVAGSSAETLKGRASDLMDSAKEVASQTTDKLKQTVDGQKNAGAEYVGNLADTLRRAAREFDADLPLAGTYIRKAASQVEDMSETIKNGDVNDLIRSAQSFARRQPTAFLGMAVLAGFGVVRFLKSSADSSQSASRAGGASFGGARTGGGGSRTSGGAYTGAGGAYTGSGSGASSGAGRSFTENTRYRDEFTK
ncbi:YtxH domain-containing protein [uncultured Bradyrhizobium sp.]|uniref:YtxH domain-containing protein n=1 Tax=uncultured Bradyrhizobium sp. TaxID=199684 RepID=UPI0035CA3068